MSITSDLVDTLFQEGLATDLPTIRKRIVDFFGDNESETKRFQIKINGNTNLYRISKSDDNRVHVFEAYVSEDRLQDITVCVNSWHHTWKQDTICNAIGYVPSNNNVRNWLFDILEEIK
jgi:hypothetical protein